MTPVRAMPLRPAGQLGVGSGELQRLGRLAGIGVLPFYLTLIFGLGALEPGYSHLTMTMSVLGGVTGPRGLAFNLGVGVTGILLLLFALGFARSFTPSWLVRAGVACMIVGGLGFVGAAVFHCSPGCRNVFLEPTLTGRIHAVAALLGGLFSATAPLLFWAAMRREEKWRPFAGSALAAALGAHLPGIFFWATILSGVRFPAVEGIAQRMGFIVVLIWVAFMAAQTWDKNMASSGSGT